MCNGYCVCLTDNPYTQDTYDQHFVESVYELPLVTVNQVISASLDHEAARVQYSTNKEYENMAKQLKLMSDLRVISFFLIILLPTTDISSNLGWSTTYSLQRNCQLHVQK